jgi:predicted Rossmann fold nucleotide-binding protein DprA/Smf involved in DNA uptake
MPAPSANTQAVLLLTSPLLQEGGKGSGKDPVLSAAEYAQLAAALQQERQQPADLINGSRDTLLSTLSASFSSERLNRLLSRGFQLSQAVEHWANRSISVIGRADPTYPRRFKQRLKRAAPPLLYACGDLDLLNAPALAVVGSRSTPEALLRQAEAVGSLAASAGVVIASGAAKGIDETAMLGSLAAGGCAIGVVADSLEKVSARPIWRRALLEGRLLLLSSDAPSARFQVWRAMGRNKLIYALADAALVVSSAKGEGGTWAGATEQLQSLHFCPVHVLSDPRGGPGLAALAEIGAHRWPDPGSPEALQALLRGTDQLPSPAAVAPLQVQQGSLLETAPSETPQTSSKPCNEPVLVSPPEPAAVSIASRSQPQATAAVEHQAQVPAAALAAFVDELMLSCLHQPLSIDELAELLDVSKTEVKRWCQRLVEQGRARKLSKPVRYVRQDPPG